MHIVSGHPHVIHFYEAFEDNDTIFIVMELAANGEVHEYIGS